MNVNVLLPLRVPHALQPSHAVITVKSANKTNPHLLTYQAGRQAHISHLTVASTASACGQLKETTGTQDRTGYGMVWCICLGRPARTHALEVRQAWDPEGAKR